ncbi:MAG TPA: sugar-binding protein [Jiangellaceae bacterium]
MKRLALPLAAAVPLILGLAVPAATAPAAGVAADAHSSKVEVDSSDDDPVKVNLMGVWSHPDDDTSIIGPCGVWNQLYDLRCGIIMHTRGEGGGNSVGDESGPGLGLRRENEDRASHFRSGTVDVFNLDRVDFFYNTSAPLTEHFWDHDETLEQTVRVIRETRPDVMVGWSPRGVGHGNHQYSGRMIWEAIKAAADPNMFPEQLQGPDALEPWLVKKTTSGGSTQGTGGQDGPHCTTGFTPSPSNPFTVHGVWTGYDSPYTWLPGNVQGAEPGTYKTWAQIGREGNRAHPTQGRLMHQGLTDPGCSRWGVTQSFVPFQPNSSPLAGQDDALFYGASIPDPGGMPLGSLFYLTSEDFFAVAGQSFEVTVHARSGDGTLPDGSVELDVPAGWTVTPAQDIGAVSDSAVSTATFTVTPAGDATAGRYKISADYSAGDITGYNETLVEVVPAVEGRFERWGNFAEFDQWGEANTFVAGRSSAVQRIGAGETITVPVTVENRTDAAQSGDVTLDVPAGYAVDAATKPYGNLAAREATTVTFELTHTDPAAPGGNNATATITTTYSSPAGSSSENLSLTTVPTTIVSEAPGAPSVDGVDGDGEYAGAVLDISRRWEGQNCADAADCGEGSYAKVNWHGDDLYLFAHVVDDVQSAAATPERCFGHWLVDSVEFLVDPRGNAVDTSTTFKMGVFPFSDDPTGAAGNGINGPCWTRDADNHQGFSSGPLADTVPNAPNAPGVEVATNAVLNEDGVWDGGSYTIEMKVPLDVLPAAAGPTSEPPTGDPSSNAIDPGYVGLNITPYDSDTQNFVGQTRLAWSPFGSQQSEPYRWGHAYLDGYEPPADRPTTPRDAIIPDSALRGVDSPQTVYQSATNGVTISGLDPTMAMDVSGVTLGESAVDVRLNSSEAGTARLFLWSGQHGYIPVFESSCPGDYDGFTACDPSDGAAPPWGDDLGGRVVGDETVAVSTGTNQVSMPIDAATFERLRADGSLLVSFESGAGQVQAFHVPLASGFLPPVASMPELNAAKAGATVALRLVDGKIADLADGSPTLTPVVCGLGAATAAAEPVSGEPAGAAGLYRWRTDADLAGTCGRLDVTTSNGTTYPAFFQFN